MKIYFITPLIICAVSYMCDVNLNTLANVVYYLNDLISCYVFGQSSHKVSNKIVKERLFTKDELSGYVGKIGKDQLYLSILGRVFDVTKGKQFYGPGESYHGFTGKDASKAFITGDFSEEGLTDDVSDLRLSDLSNLKDWLKRYDDKYIYMGKLIGRYYDANGKKTDYLKIIESKFTAAEESNELNENYNKNYPPCNIEWSPEKGSRVWCSNRSGGIKRDWIGVPRKIFLPGWMEYRCACIKLGTEELIEGGKLKFYDNCDIKAESCYVGND